MRGEMIGGRDAACGITVTSEEMKEIERRADEAGLSYYQMMENAGAAAAEYILRCGPVAGKRVLVVCGKGNNGGDGFVVARKLAEQGAFVNLVLAEGEPKTADAVKNHQLCRAMSLMELGLTRDGEETKGKKQIAGAEKSIDAAEKLIADADLIVDAIYGTGFHGWLREPVKRICRMINRSEAAVYSLDIPSGLNGDTGEAEEDTIRADHTVVFHRLKPAHADENCAIYCGETVCVSIGIEAVLK